MPSGSWPPLPLFVDRPLAMAVLDGIPGAGAEDVSGLSNAGLFSRLRGLLRDRDDLVDLTGSDGAAWDRLAHGVVVELVGEIARNPVVELLEFVLRLFPLAHEADDQPTRATRSRRAASASPGEAAALSLFRLITEDVQTARTQDALFRLASADVTCLLTLPRDFGEGRTLEDLLGMRTRVLGKVVRLLGPEDRVSLVRRSTLGSAAGELLRSGIAEIAEMTEIPLPASDVEVRGPSLFVLPIAIFV